MQKHATYPIQVRYCDQICRAALGQQQTGDNTMYCVRFTDEFGRVNELRNHHDMWSAWEDLCWLDEFMRIEHGHDCCAVIAEVRP